jgi:hypothetical protein
MAKLNRREHKLLVKRVLKNQLAIASTHHQILDKIPKKTHLIIDTTPKNSSFGNVRKL